jgi:hypothetical protein
MRQAATMIAAAAVIGVVAAAHFGIGFSGVRARVLVERMLDADTETTGSVGPAGARGERLPLSDEQLWRIYDGVMRIHDAPTADLSPPEVAQALPQNVPLQDLPTAVTREVPQLRDHKFVKLDDRILVINPANRIVVAMIPRYKLLQ